MLVGRAAAAAAVAVCHLQDVADDGLFVHRGTGRHRRRCGRGGGGGRSSDCRLAPEQLLLAATLQVLQEVLQLAGLRSKKQK